MPFQDFFTLFFIAGVSNDSFAYRLEAPGVQPANGLFEFVLALHQEVGSKTVSNPITEDVTGVGGNEESVRSELVISIGAIFILILILTVAILVVRVRRASKSRYAGKILNFRHKLTRQDSW